MLIRCRSMGLKKKNTRKQRSNGNWTFPKKKPSNPCPVGVNEVQQRSGSKKKNTLVYKPGGASGFFALGVGGAKGLNRGSGKGKKQRQRKHEEKKATSTRISKRAQAGGIAENGSTDMRGEWRLKVETYSMCEC